MSSSNNSPTDSLWRILETLANHKVEFTIVGNFGSVLHGVAIGTKDIDFLAKQTTENYDRLAKAMLELKAKYRDVEDVDVPWSGALISSQIFGNFTCEYGDFDVIKEIPAGKGGTKVGYDELIDRSDRIQISELHIHVASLEDIIASKKAANREKDHLTLPILEKFLQQRRTEQQKPPGQDLND